MYEGKSNLRALTAYDAGQGLCPICGHEIGPFKSDLGRREYRISGMCQGCQYDAFSERMSPDEIRERPISGRMVKSTGAWWEVVSVRALNGGVALELGGYGGILHVGNDQQVLVRDKEG